MKRAILAILLSATSAFGADMEVTLDAPVTVKKTTVVDESVSLVGITYIVIDVKQKRIEVEFEGISDRLVHPLTNPQFNSFKTSFVSNYGAILKSMIVKYFTPPSP